MSTPLGKKTFAEYKKAIKEKEIRLEKLSKVHKVKFTLVGEMEDAETKLRTLIRTGDELYSDSSGVIREIEDGMAELDGLFTELERVTKGILEFQNIIYGLTQEAEKVANDLGIREEDLPGYTAADNAASDADDRISDFDSRLNDMENYIKG